MGIVVSVVSLIMTNTSRTYASVNYLLANQYDAQLAMAHIQENVIDVNDSVVWYDNAWDGGASILTVKRSETATAKISTYIYEKDEATIFYKEQTIYHTEKVELPTNADGLDVLVRGVNEFEVELTEVLPDNLITDATVTIELENGGRIYNVEQVIALRNKVFATTE